MKSDVEMNVKDVVNHWGGIDEIYAYRRGTVGFVRFKTVDAMWAFIKGFNAKDAVKPTHDGRQLWAGPSRSLEDRRKRKQFSTHKTVLVEVGLANPEQVDYDVRRGILWFGKERIAEWYGDDASGKLVLNQEKLQIAGLKVEAKILADAVAEKMAGQ